MSPTTEVALRLPFELTSLAEAHRYQKWIMSRVLPYMGRRILEFGSGIGSMSQHLPVRDRLILSEVEPSLFSFLERTSSLNFRNDPKVDCLPLGASEDLYSVARRERIDTIVSFNVMEHIEQDELVFAALFDVLRQNPDPSPQRLVTFVPALPWAYGSVDRAFGHYRRYSHQGLLEMFRRLAPDFDCEYRYMNAIGVFPWLLMGRVLRRDGIGDHAVSSFEMLIPFIRHIDDFIHGPLGLPFGQSLWVVATRR